MTAMTPKILCVDDDANMLASYQRSLRRQFNLDTAQGGEAALAIMAVGGPYAVILSDMSMPGMSGIQFLARAKEIAPHSVRMMLTGNADLATAMDALNSGSIFRFLLKPCPPDTLAAHLLAGIEQYRLIQSERELLEKTLQGSVRMLMEILAMVNPELFGRAQTLRGQMRTLAEALGLGGIWKLELAALLCQIGLVTLPTAVLRKLGARQPLTEDEAQLAARVPEISHNLIVKIPRLEPVAEAVRYARKHYDGSGPPADDVAGEAIPVGARLLRVLADLAEIQAAGVSAAAAFGIMGRRAGFYDPQVLEAARARFAPAPAPPADAGPGGVPIAAAHLCSGLVLASDLLTADGTLLVSAGRTLTDALLERVRNFSALSGLREPILIEAPATRAA
ncbi:MAG: response regulator [Armatimonadetes bacterium]|nr:response regulator [Armatimonadota bacterium]